MNYIFWSVPRLSKRFSIMDFFLILPCYLLYWIYYKYCIYFITWLLLWLSFSRNNWCFKYKYILFWTKRHLYRKYSVNVMFRVYYFLIISQELIVCPHAIALKPSCYVSGLYLWLNCSSEKEGLSPKTHQLSNRVWSYDGHIVSSWSHCEICFLTIPVCEYPFVLCVEINLSMLMHKVFAPPCVFFAVCWRFPSLRRAAP